MTLRELFCRSLSQSAPPRPRGTLAGLFRQAPSPAGAVNSETSEMSCCSGTAGTQNGAAASSTGNARTLQQLMG